MTPRRHTQELTPPPGGAQTWSEWRDEVNAQLRGNGKALSRIQGGLFVIGVLIGIAVVVSSGLVENVAGKASAAEVVRHENRFHK